MKKVEKEALKLLAKIADENATAKDKSTSFCPVLLYQPKRPLANKKHS